MPEPIPAVGRYDPYEVVAEIGAGSYSRVYKVRHKRLGSFHALKVLQAQQEGAIERLVQEGRIQAQLRHRHIVQVTDLIAPSKYEMGLVMEYIEGPSLEQVLKQRGALPMHEALNVFHAVLEGVAAAHGAGVLHRDIKPANILLSKERRAVVPKVTDFGLARPQARDSITKVGFGLGTPGYIAPEQAKDATKSDQRADIFSLGVLLYEMLTGTQPFERGDFLATLQATKRGNYKPLDMMIDNAPQDISDAIDMALNVEPDHRYPTIDEFAFAVFGEALMDDPPSSVDVGDVTADTIDIQSQAETAERSRQLFHHLTLRDISLGVLLGCALSLVIAVVLVATGLWGWMPTDIPGARRAAAEQATVPADE